jgi:hypothetical protein
MTRNIKDMIILRFKSEFARFGDRKEPDYSEWLLKLYKTSNTKETPF